ncbi:hypothetical protein IAG25_35410 [Caballeronia sp. EK]|uniref:hypothetical protein n=1 Tax=Caballeronia sp. EK TaxID=2767469 RepID=UPI001655E9F1|nr:hypothetical protein [Caballeronia sp. EK]MBC8642097.1 hypothetical protein [Caballeronia sp. EK]
MTSHERFMKWRSTAKLYGRDSAPCAWEAWQEAERMALERAAERCMSILGYPSREYYADAIRAMIKQDGN